MPTRSISALERETKVELVSESSAAALAETLSDLGVKHIFGMESPEDMHAALDLDAITPITVRDERAGAIMADGYARASDRPGVCSGMHGAGVTNLIQGLIEAWLSSIPVVAIAGESAHSDRYRHLLQDIDQLPFFRPITKWAVTIGDPDRVSEMTAHGFSVATSGRPGPVYLGYPADVLTVEARRTNRVSPEIARYPAHRVAPDPTSVAQAAELLRGADRPAVVAGGGVLLSGATDELARVAELLGAPVATTLHGKGSFDETDERFAGVVGGYTGGLAGRGRIANAIVRDADVVIMVGAKADSIATDNWTVPDPRSVIVHLDIDPVEIGRNYPLALGVVGDAKLGLAALADHLNQLGGAPTEWARERIRDEVAKWERSHHQVQTSDAAPIRPERVYAELAAALSRDAIVATDASYCSAWAMDLLKLNGAGRKVIAPRGYGSLGWGLPAAIGAKLAAPDRSVVAITGDGGFAYVSQELETAARYGLALVVIVLNNQGLGFQTHFEQKFWNREGDTRFLDVDHALLASAMRCHGMRVTDPADLASAIRDALASDGPALIDVCTDHDAMPGLVIFD